VTIINGHRLARRVHRHHLRPAAIALVVLIVIAHTWPLYTAIVAGLLATLGIVWAVRGARRWWFVHHSRIGDAPLSIHAYETATPAQFEHQIAALCRRDGARDVQVVGGAGDLAADVLLTTPHGRRMLIQAKRYQHGNNVGSEHVQRVNGTYREFHGCQLAAIVTTSAFTRAAAEAARHVGIRLYDNTKLARWANGTGPAPWA
jgi:restriction system protein